MSADGLLKSFKPAGLFGLESHDQLLQGVPLVHELLQPRHPLGCGLLSPLLKEILASQLTLLPITANLIVLGNLSLLFLSSLGQPRTITAAQTLISLIYLTHSITSGSGGKLTLIGMARLTLSEHHSLELQLPKLFLPGEFIEVSVNAHDSGLVESYLLSRLDRCYSSAW